MELQSGKACIISAAIGGGWYEAGLKRLEKSLNFVGSPFDTCFFTHFDGMPDYPYYFKICAFEAAIKQGYRIILWLDSSFWAIKSPMRMFDIINEQGYYCFSSGFNLAQSVNDTALQAVGLSRDDAEGVTEWATGAVGINLDNPNGEALYKQWKEYMDMGLSKGSRLHAGQSQDPRFLHHRQDQTAFSLAMWKLGLYQKKGLDMVAYFNSGHNINELTFWIGGL